jgi:hypothetical protein
MGDNNNNKGSVGGGNNVERGRPSVTRPGNKNSEHTHRKEEGREKTFLIE